MPWAVHAQEGPGPARLIRGKGLIVATRARAMSNLHTIRYDTYIRDSIGSLRFSLLVSPLYLPFSLYLLASYFSFLGYAEIEERTSLLNKELAFALLRSIRSRVS